MVSLCRVIPGSSQVRLPTAGRGRGQVRVSRPISSPVALQAIRSSGFCKRNAVRRRTRAALIPAQMRRGLHVAIAVACVPHPSHTPLPFAGEA